jgi:SWI/SNF chromatin-remodeling complex subunit SWI1
VFVGISPFSLGTQRAATLKKSSMSVPSGWLPDSAAIVHQNPSAAFANPDPSSGMHFDPSASVLPQQAVGGLDQGHFHQQQQPRNQLQNGHSGHSSPGFPPSAYSVNPVVPLKRARPRDDSISISPRPAPQGLPPSRSHTPLSQNQQLAYQIYQNNQQQPQRQYTPVGYNSSHLHHVGSANATPSPVMQNQSFNSQTNSAPKRVATQSPSPFSPAPSQQGFMSQGSPPPRVDTPQNGNINMPMQQSYSQAYTQGFQSPAPTASASPAPGPGMAQNQMHAQMVYAQMQARQQQQQQLHQQQQAAQQQQLPSQQQQAAQQQARYMQQQQQAQAIAAAQGGHMNAMQMQQQMNPNAMGQNPNQMQRPQQPNSMASVQRATTDPHQFMRSLQDFMAKRGTPIQSNPIVAGKPVNLVNLYASVLKLGGSQRVHAENKWPHIAMSLGYSPEHFPMSAGEIAEVFREYLAPYEDAWMRNQRDRQKQMAMQQARHNPQVQNQTPQGHHEVTSNAQYWQQPQRPPGPMQSMQHIQSRPPMQNGYGPQPTVPRQPTPLQQPPSTPQRASIDATPPPGHMGTPGFAMGTPMGKAMPPQTDFLGTPATPVRDSQFKPKVRVLDTHGGINVGVMQQLGQELVNFRPTAPTYQELGLIDIHALTMMLKSGITAEIKVALDTLVIVSVEGRQSIALESCEDLLEALVDVAEAQVEFLGEHAPEGTEIMSLMAYEDVLRACRVERDSMLDTSRFGSLENELERATDKLICTTTILRNLSFFESNHNSLAGPTVVRFVSGVIERLGTCPLFLRSYINLLDFMKDIIIYLSNLAHAIVLPSEDEALNLLHLILAFAPQPLPHVSGRESIMFASYSPSVHRYLAPAVDTLAKLLARDDPNRAFYRTIFLSESNTNLPYDLLTRAFALAISPIPDNNRGAVLHQTVEARKPILEQGLLAAEILAQMCPGNEHGLARSWLDSEDGFALSLLRLVCLLSPHTTHMQMQQRPPRGMNQDDIMPFARITHRGMSVLRTLARKADDVAGDSSQLPVGVLPKKESLLGALLTTHIDGTIVKELCSYAGLDD